MILRKLINIAIGDMIISKIFESIDKNFSSNRGIKVGDFFSSINFIYNRYTSNPSVIYNVEYHDCTILESNNGAFGFKYEKVSCYNVHGEKLEFVSYNYRSSIFGMDVDKVESLIR